MATRGGLRWKSDTLTGSVKAFPERVDRAIVAAFEVEATATETRAKRNAPWTDRFGTARKGLFTTTQHWPLRAHRLTLSHGPNAPYGIWLEIRWQGKYAIIMPTINQAGKNIMRRLDKVLDRMGVKS